ncbi:hypothetical protein TGGT1_264130 [Toxoplasma gondii GT1]|uniref:Pre-mRNA-splicing factor CWC26, related protein n=3 Tax=Toxoplasma gondii TaxID=5811 RepID=S7UXV6_TOXGG|nr:hypothetical protein TGGT1_264130 [Toxoplasma gondii GT1]KAF4640889.1 hypothetical protein TGRH88_066970 [Toxoplasma gondii]KFH10156.1 pre-mRNA-splicing factor CWC26, related protein [Toxoplasma gondii VAND]RQX71046.1 pre-mRNA-splicing factor CWC26, related protein [Toxoplasma gondii CAST]
MSSSSKKSTHSGSSTSSSASKLDYLKKYMAKGGSDGGGTSGKKKRKGPGASEGSRETGFRLNDASEEVDVRAPARRRPGGSLAFNAAQFGRVLRPTVAGNGKAYAYQLEEGFDSEGSDEHQDEEDIVVVDADGRNVALNELQAKRVHAIVRDQEAREMGLPRDSGARGGGVLNLAERRREDAGPSRHEDSDWDDRGASRKKPASDVGEEVGKEKGIGESASSTVSGIKQENDIDLAVFNAPFERSQKPGVEGKGPNERLDVGEERPDLSPLRRRRNAGGSSEDRERSTERSRQDERGSLERGARDALSLASGKLHANALSTERQVVKRERKDMSPPRRWPPVSDGLSAEREREDLSPPRRRGTSREEGNSGSPGDVQRLRQGEDLSPPRRRPTPSSVPSQTMQLSCSSAFLDSHERRKSRSPERRTDRDLSPPRRRDGGSRNEMSGRENDSDKRGREEVQRRSESRGSKSTGLLTLDDYRASGIGTEKEPSLLTKDKLAREVVRQVVYRDRQGRIITEEEWLELQDQKRGKRRKKERSPPPELEWGKGLVQKEAREKQAQEDAKVAQQPLTRYDIDEEYDRNLQDRARWEDPMNQVPQKADESRATPAVPEQSKGKEHPKCPHDAPRNRFGILPGYRWDGVVRGNGYEDRRLKAINRKNLEARMAHMNNVADM